MKEQLHWQTLQRRRHQAKVTMLSKVWNGLVAIPAEQYLIPNTRRARRGHQCKYMHCSYNLNVYGFPSFHQRYICGIIYHQTFVHWVWIPSRTECQLHSSNDCWVLILSINMHLYYCNIVLSVFAPRENTNAPYTVRYFQKDLHYIHCVQEKTPTHIFFHISVNNVRI